MLYRTMPGNGDELSILGFGCMRLPQKDGKIDEDRAARQLRHAIDQGVNYVDTAWPYHAGESEPFVGRALADGYREKVKLATKLPSWMIHNRQDMDVYLNAQLEKLRTRRIDYYLIHSLNAYQWNRLVDLGVLDFLDDAKASGRIANAGFSSHATLADFKPIVDAYPWEFCQIQYNFLDEENQAGTEGLLYAASKGLGLIVMEPLRGGKLANPAQPPPVDEIWKQAPRQRPPVEWALRWVWNHPEVTVVLSGMNEEAHVDENLAIAAEALPGSLTEPELELVGRVSRKFREIMKVGCTGCGYCTPCPMDVDIPGIFQLFNDGHMFGNLAESKFIYALRMGGLVTGKPGYASQCEQCQDCVEKCPQELAIPDLLEQVVAEFEGPDLSQREAMVRQMMGIG